MMQDWGSRDQHFIALTANIVSHIRDIYGDPTSAPVLLQGSGTFAVEAMLGTFIGPQDKALILINGAYGQRILSICKYLQRQTETLTQPETEPTNPAAVAKILEADSTISHVVLVHVETTTGIRNPLAEISQLCREHGKKLLVDAMSSFGGIDLNWSEYGLSALAASSNKCLEGPPGIGFVICNTEDLLRTCHTPPSLALDLKDQWRGFEKNGQWRFTPPVQVVAGFHQALKEFAAEGGSNRRQERYQDNCRRLRNGLESLGFTMPIPAELQAPVIVTFARPSHPQFDFDEFYHDLKEQGFVIYPGKLTQLPTFRVGCIGQVYPEDIDRFVATVGKTLKGRGVQLI